MSWNSAGFGGMEVCHHLQDRRPLNIDRETIFMHYSSSMCSLCSSKGLYFCNCTPKKNDMIKVVLSLPAERWEDMKKKLGVRHG